MKFKVWRGEQEVLDYNFEEVAGKYQVLENYITQWSLGDVICITTPQNKASSLLLKV